MSKPECGDILLGSAFELVVSEHFREIYVANGLTGLSDFLPLEVLGIQNSHYYVATPKVTFTHLDESGSGLVWEQEPSCNNCRLGVIGELKRVVLNQKTWDGSDIFMATGLYGRKIVTERFVNAVERGRLTNFVFVPSIQYSIP